MSIELKLTAANQTERRILDYLTANASEVLAEKINAGAKTLAGAMKFAKDEAHKLTSDNGVVCVDDDTVFGWIVHFFEEETIQEEKKKEPIVRMPAGVAKQAKPEKPVRNEKAIARAKKNNPGRSKPEKQEQPAKPAKPVKAAKPVEPVKPDAQLSLFDALFAPEGKA